MIVLPNLDRMVFISLRLTIDRILTHFAPKAVEIIEAVVLLVYYDDMLVLAKTIVLLVAIVLMFELVLRMLGLELVETSLVGE
jgi:hypothetical protein